MVNNCVPRQQLGNYSVTRPFLSLRRVWLARLHYIVCMLTDVFSRGESLLLHTAQPTSPPPSATVQGEASSSPIPCSSRSFDRSASDPCRSHVVKLYCPLNFTERCSLFGVLCMQTADSPTDTLTVATVLVYLRSQGLCLTMQCFCKLFRGVVWNPGAILRYAQNNLHEFD